jgi:hypothetical protein
MVIDHGGGRGARRQQTLARVAESARAIVREARLSHVARMMEMSPAMLEEYLAGAPGTLKHPVDGGLAAWVQKAERLTDPHARAWVRFILGSLAALPESQQMPAAADLLRILESQYISAQGAAPSWVQQLLSVE